MSTARGTSETLDCTIMTFDHPWKTRGVGICVLGSRVKAIIAIDWGDRQPAPITEDLCYWCSCEKALVDNNLIIFNKQRVLFPHYRIIMNAYNLNTFHYFTQRDKLEQDKNSL